MTRIQHLEINLKTTTFNIMTAFITILISDFDLTLIVFFVGIFRLKKLRIYVLFKIILELCYLKTWSQA